MASLLEKLQRGKQRAGITARVAMNRFVPEPAPSERGGGGVQAGTSFLAQIMAQHALPKFSGRDVDWEAFTEEWHVFEEMIRHETGDVSDYLLLKVLSNCLDAAGQNLLMTRMRQNPRLSFREFWKEIGQFFARDMPALRRREWQNIRLYSAGELSLQEWRTFQTAFELATSRVEDLTDIEIETRLKAELPTTWRVRLERETSRRAKNAHWVKFLKPCAFLLGELETAVSEVLDGANVHVEEYPQYFLVDCKTEASQETVLELDGCRDDGFTLQVRKTFRHLSWREIFKWVTQELRIAEEVGQYDPLPRVQTVHDSRAASAEPTQTTIKTPAAREWSGSGQASSSTKWQDQTRDSPQNSSSRGRGTSPDRAETKAPVQDGKGKGKGKGAGKGKGGKKGGKGSREICNVCQAAGKPAEHPYFECDEWRKHMRKSWGKSSPPTNTKDASSASQPSGSK